MKKYLLPPEGQFYKANLHCHSTVSDAELSPEELKRVYREKGYSVLAITDHEWMQPHPELNDETFLTINSYEMTIRDGDRTTPDNRVIHMNFYAKDPNEVRMVCYDPEWVVKYCKKLTDDQLYRQERGENVGREYSAECINRLTARAKEMGFLVSYNHPGWNMEQDRDYLNYDGFFAVEVYNHSCFMDVGLPEENVFVYDRMLRSGKRLFCTCNDDNHNRRGMEPHVTDSFGGFNMIKAPELSYSAIMQALEKGDFYASTGPEIHDVYVEDGQLHVRCSPVRDILLNTSGRFGGHARAKEGEALTEAVFQLKDIYHYVRLTLIDHAGRKAFSRACFPEEWQEE